MSTTIKKNFSQTNKISIFSQKSLQAVIDMAKAGDVIYLAAGVHVIIKTLQIYKPLHLRGTISDDGKNILTIFETELKPNDYVIKSNQWDVSFENILIRQKSVDTNDIFQRKKRRKNNFENQTKIFESCYLIDSYCLVSENSWQKKHA